MTRKKIHVTAEDIAKGERYDPTGCPTSLALQREFGQDISVGPDNWSFERGDMLHLSRRTQDFIFRFDGRLTVEPFNFFTEVP